MESHPIEDLMTTIMTNLKQMIDVNTIVGNQISVGTSTIIPISKVSYGFAAGGSEFSTETMADYAKNNEDEEVSYKLPFGGGSGAGANIVPIAFLIVDSLGNGKVIYLDNTTAVEKILEYIPDAVNKAGELISKVINNKKNKASDEAYIRV